MLTCPWCGEVEPNEMLLQNNHWVKRGPLPAHGYDWCREHGMCIGQELVLNHLHYDLTKGATTERLRQTLERAETKWVIREDKPAILAEAREALARRERAARVPAHHEVSESEAVALW